MNRGASMWDMRMMAAANRSEMPFERMAGRGYGHQGISGNPMLSSLMGSSGEPDYSQFTYDPVMRQRAIDAGIQPLEASQVKQNVVLPNTGFFGRHQRLSNAIEGGMFGALAAHGGMTPGDTIQGTLEGIVGGPRLRQGMQREQFARPFEAASMLEGIADRKQTRELHEMEIQHLRAENQKLGRPDHDFRAFGVSRNDPTIATVDSTTGKVTTVSNPDYDPAISRAQTLEGNLDIGTREQLAIAGVEPGKATPAQIGTANKLAQAQAVARAGAVGGAQAGAKLPYQNYQDARTQHDKRITEYQGKMLKSDDKNHRQQIEDEHFNEWQEKADAAKAAGQKPPPYRLITESEINAKIKENNAGVQSQIDAEQAAFNNQWPQAMEAPPVKKGKGSSAPPVRDYTNIH